MLTVYYKYILIILQENGKIKQSYAKKTVS